VQNVNKTKHLLTTNQNKMLSIKIPKTFVLKNIYSTTIFKNRKLSAGSRPCCAKIQVLPKVSLVDERLSTTVITELEPNSKGNSENRHYCDLEPLR
jgi:hypothetical protein